jgi:hypothetical protein
MDEVGYYINRMGLVSYPGVVLLQGLCIIFENIINCVETQHQCVVRSFTTDADGGSKGGGAELKKKCPWLFAPSCWGHQVNINVKVLIQFFTKCHCSSNSLLATISKSVKPLQRLLLKQLN